MSSKSKLQSEVNQKARQKNAYMRSLKSGKANQLAKNHVSEDTKSPGGMPFHFAGPKKSTSTSSNTAKNRAKRARKELRAS